jgi:geranylgeranyl diphosphate synthase, type I
MKPSIGFSMPEKKDFERNKVEAIIEEKGSRIRGRIKQTLLSNVTNPELLSILKEVSDNWRDVFRPALTALSCEAVGGKPEETDDAGLMFALASAGFGIHDDIIDFSERKHFRTTVLGCHGLQSTLLVGDLLIVKGWTVVHEMLLHVSPEMIKAVIEEYGKFNVEICEAEFMENRCRKKLQTDLKTHENMLWKAMAEIEACTKIGAILGRGDNTEVRALAEFGRRLGFAYRLTDEVRDTLNIEGNLLHRIEHESVPLPILFASKSSQQRYERIESIIQKSPLNKEDIEELLEICFDSKAFEYVFDLAKRNEEKNLINLRSLRPTNVRDLLSSIDQQSFANIAELTI